MLVILRILFTVQAPVVASLGPVINPLWDGDYFNIEKTKCNLYSYKETKDMTCMKRQEFGWI
jgi:hypothetical protein